MDKKATIRDVAKKAGVSLATASRVLGHSAYPVSVQARQKVLEAAEQLDYVPNEAARSLRTELSRDIALVIPNVSNPFYLQAMLGINEELINQSYNLILCNTMRDPEQEHRYLRQLYERQTRGVILSSVDENAGTIESYAKKGMKFVLLDQMIAGTQITGINFDTRGGARMATEYLISKGHRRIAFATLPLTRWTRNEVHKGYCDALAIAGIPIEEKYIYEFRPERPNGGSDLEFFTGQKIAGKFLEDRCDATAILCINDMVAIGVIQTLIRSGKRVPEDVSVVGFDDIPYSAAYIPPLTTVHYPAAETGRLAAMMILDCLKNEDSEMHLSMNLAPRMVIRETVAAPKQQETGPRGN